MDSLRVEIFTPREKRAAAAFAISLLVLGLSVAWALRGAVHPAPPAAAHRYGQFMFVSGTEAYALAGTSDYVLHNQDLPLAQVSAYHTTDGAQNWHRLAMPAGAQGLPLNLQPVPGGGVLLTAGDPVGANASSFWFSRDGGSSWRRFNTPMASRGTYVDLIDARTGYMVGHEDAALTVYWTRDAGASWRRTLSLDAANPVAGDLSISGPYLGPVFDDTSHGWIMSGSFVPRPGGARPVLLRSSDGGTGWHEVPIPAPPDKSFTLDVPVFPQNGPHGFLALGGAAGMLIYETVDGGQTWSPPYQTGVPWFESDAQSWVYSDGRYLETSRDWGRTWTRTLAQLPALGLALGHVVPAGPVLWSFPNGGGSGSDSGSQTVLLRSADSGASWSRARWPGV